ncbi:MAG: IclR family transcriptional regulator, acetate operon repressor [Gaiellales bacterium]|jgi:DNA-binding IclR family transcriptional regulator|nr:IclR family transcriptional regulator, acetate operon repressor [Gaiellales bacterium]
MRDGISDTAQPPDSGNGGGTRIQSVARACQLLLWLADRRHGASAKEIAFAHRLTLPTAYHLLNTLVDQGLLAKDSQRRFVLGRSSEIVAQAYMRASAVPENLLLALRELAAQTQEVVCLADWCGQDIRVLASVDGNNVVRIAEMMNAPYDDAHARANGKLLLAYAWPEVRDAYLRDHPRRRRTEATICSRAEFTQELERIRDRGFAYDEQEFAQGLSCVAAPLLDNGTIVASIAVSSPTERFARSRGDLTAAVVGVIDGVRSGRFG